VNKKLSVELNGLGRSLLLSLLLSLLAAVLIYYTSLQETLMVSLANIIIILSVFWGGCHVSKTYGSKGLLHGSITGIFFFFFLLAVTLFIDLSLVTAKSIIYTLLACTLSGGLGGILGIGLSD